MAINKVALAIALSILIPSTLSLHASEQTNKVAVVRMPWFSNPGDHDSRRYDGDEPVEITATLSGKKYSEQVFKLLGCKKKFFWLQDKQLIELADEYEDCFSRDRELAPSSESIRYLADYKRDNQPDDTEPFDSTLGYEGQPSINPLNIPSPSTKPLTKKTQTSNTPKKKIPSNTVNVLAKTKAYKGGIQLALMHEPRIFSIWATETEGNHRDKEVLDPCRVTTVFAHALSKPEEDHLLSRIQKILREAADAVETIQSDTVQSTTPQRQSICEQSTRMLLGSGQ